MRAVTQTVDGRTARSARTREAVVTAVLELVRQGNLRPTAKEIAARAGISLRSVYVHFDDLEDLFDAAGARQTEEIAHLLYAIDPALDLPARIDEVVRQRSAIWEALAPVRQAALLWATSSSNLRERTQRINRRAVRDLDRIFAVELEGHAWSEESSSSKPSTSPAAPARGRCCAPNVSSRSRTPARSSPLR